MIVSMQSPPPIVRRNMHSAKHVEGSQCPSTKEGLTAYRLYVAVPFLSIKLKFILQ